MNVILSIILALTFLVACSQPRVFELGPDTYITSATTVEASEAERLALVEASEHCATMGKEIAIMKSSNVIPKRIRCSSPRSLTTYSPVWE